MKTIAWKKIFRNSFAFYRFKVLHTKLNDFYWQAIQTRYFAFKYAKTQGWSGSESRYSLGVSDPEILRRFSETTGDWQERVKDFENWLRINVLLAANSYFERYISDIVFLAIQSDPGIIWGASKTVLGIDYLKKGIKVPCQEIIQKCIMGVWSKRYSAIKKLFGTDFPQIESNLGSFEKIRKIRNQYAHQFTKDEANQINHLVNFDGDLERISEKRIKEYLSLIEASTISLDSHIHANHIGIYELFLFWKRWKKECPKKIRTNWNEWQILQYGVKQILGLPGATKKICQDSNEKYNRL